MHVLTLKITSEFENISTAAKQFNEFLNKNGLDPILVSSFEMCLVEALNNVVEHAYEMSGGNPIEINVLLSDLEFSITIIDEGKTRTNFDKPSLDFDPENIDSLPEGGMGLFIIEELMDETNYSRENGKNFFQMKKTFHDPPR